MASENIELEPDTLAAKNLAAVTSALPTRAKATGRNPSVLCSAIYLESGRIDPSCNVMQNPAERYEERKSTNVEICWIICYNMQI